MFCTISNEICEHPVISKKTGHIYERSLLEKHLKITGKCPVTEDDMTMDDVIEVKGYQQPSQPKPATASSIPVLLKTLQNEWDQMMLESYNLKKHVQDLRQQLSHSLYQHDAACRVIARLTQERDRAVQQLANTRQTMALAIADAQSKSIPTAAPGTTATTTATTKATPIAPLSSSMQGVESQDIDMGCFSTQQQKQSNKENENSSKTAQDSTEMKEIEMSDKNKNKNKKDDLNTLEGIANHYPSNLWNATELSKDVIDAITVNSAKLSEARKKRRKQKNENLATAEMISKYSLSTSYNSHSEQDTGITCMDLHSQASMNKYIVTGGIDCNVIVSNRETRTLDHILRGHTKKVTNVEFHSNLPIIVSCSADHTSRVWRYDSNTNHWKTMTILDKTHTASVTDLSVHCLDCYFGTCSYDGTWALSSLHGKTLLRLYDTSGDSADGKDNKNAMKLDGISGDSNDTNGNANGRIKNGFTTIAMHPDGQLVGTGCENGNLVKIWDIRDSKVGATFEGHEGSVNKIIFNENGYYLGSCDDYGICKIWDLRKIGRKEGCYTIDTFEKNRIKTIAFDKTGTYLAIGQSNGVEIIQCKKWNKIHSFYNHNRDVTGIAFGPNAQFIVSAAKDRKINVYSMV